AVARPHGAQHGGQRVCRFTLLHHVAVSSSHAMVFSNTLWLPADPRRRNPVADRKPPLGVEELRTLVASGEIDTVVLAFPDMQGRLQGKRFAARFFLDEVLHHGTEGCNYLLAVDTEMNTVDGYAMSSWERGYGDFAMHPDLRTLRRVPWNAGTAMLIADLAWNDGSPVLAAPRQI